MKKILSLLMISAVSTIALIGCDLTKAWLRFRNGVNRKDNKTLSLLNRNRITIRIGYNGDKAKETGRLPI